MTRPVNTILAISIIVIIAVIVGGVIWWQVSQSTEEISPASQVAPTGQEIVSPSESAKSEVKRIIDPGVNWLPELQKLGDLNLFNKENYSAQYYKIADVTDGGELIFASVESMGAPTYRFKKDKDGIYFLLKNNSDSFPDDLRQLLNKDKYEKALIQVDYSKVYNSLVPPQVLIHNQVEFVKNSFPESGWLELDNTAKDSRSVEKIGLTPYGDLYSGKSTIDDKRPKIKRIDYLLKLSDTSMVYYTIRKDFLADDGTLIATLNNNGKLFASKKFVRGFSVGGCGLGINDQIYDDESLGTRLTTIGTTPSGANLYSPTNNDDEIFKVTYESYKIGREQDKNLLSYETFVSKKPVLVWKDPLNNYVIFTDMDYAALAECGKPVMYLYPEKTTQVSVKVGANIRVSEPLYNSGWLVTANPDGSIINQDGKAYENLYWEGKGSGIYPLITRGRVVQQENIENELRNDLSSLGLNKKESDDFISFWLPKMPKDPFIRLTWLNTQEMNQLAPLVITPKPDTLIRVFLDFAGQNTSNTNLMLQALPSVKRNGFTVVEWGGLLVGGQ